MKKLLISIVLILLVVLAYYVIVKNVTIFSWTSTSINDIENLSAEFDAKFEKAVELNDRDYKNKIDALNNSITDLKKAKEKYENKMKYISEDIELGVVEIKQYKIEKLWIILEQYAKDEGIDLKLDIVESTKSDAYDLNITATGEYIGITDFIYDIEKDDTLGFKITNFKLIPYAKLPSTTQMVEESGGTKYETEKTVSVHVETLTGTFKIESVGIDFD